MTKENLKKVFSEFGYGDISKKWISPKKISRFNLTTNGSLFVEGGHTIAEYKFDETHELLLKRLVNKSGKVIKYCAIVNIAEIISIEALSVYSESVFNGNNNLLR